MKKLVYAMIVLLALAHQDFWWWDRIDPLVFGFIPIGLAYQAGVSIAAATLWAMAVKFCWPKGLEGETDASSTTGGDA
jgi:Protein of unknown function (DUF3311)